MNQGAASAVAPRHLRASAPALAEATTITAELPTAVGRGYRPLPEHPSRRPGRRDPAPELLRFVVWVLAFAVLIAGAGLVVEAVRPAWFSFLRETTPSPSARGGSNNSTKSTSAPTTNAFSPVSEGSTSATYQVPSSTFTIAVLSPGRCYVEIKEPPSSSSWAYAQTIPGSAKAADFAVSGPSSVQLEASATSLTVLSGSRVVGVIKDPREAYTYIFDPAS
jgi:hypothetical protein